MSDFVDLSFCTFDPAAVVEIIIEKKIGRISWALRFQESKPKWILSSVFPQDTVTLF